MGRTGLSTQLTQGEETAYGTPAADLTRAYEIRSEELEDAIERIESEALRAGRRVQQHWRPNRKGAEGAIEYEVANKGFGLPLKHGLGAIATTQPDATGAPTVRDHTATLGDLFGKSRTIQVGRPDVGGVVNPFTLLGGKVSEWEFSVEVDGLLTYSETLDFQDVRTPDTTPAGPALAAAAYPADIVPLDFIGAQIQVAGVPVDLSSFSLSCSNNLKTDRYFLRNSSLKKEPLEDTEAREITGELGGEFENRVAYNRFVQGTEAALVALFEGATIAVVGGTTYRFGVQITCPRVRWDGGSPTAGGADVLEQPQEIKVLAPTDGSSPVSIRYRTTDTAP